MSRDEIQVVRESDAAMSTPSADTQAASTRAFNIPTRAEMQEMGFGSDEELAISLPVWESDDDSDGEASVPTKPGAAEEWQQTCKTRELMLTLAPQHNHADRKLHADASLLAPPDIGAAAGIDSRHVTQFADCTEFHEEYVRQRRPVMLRGVPEQGLWRALDRWSTVECMSTHYGDMPLKVWEVASAGGMGKGMAVELSMRRYAEYAAENTVDSPFYVFQKHFQPQHDALRADYAVPPSFADDLYSLTPKIRAQFPLYRYFVVGGARTGSNMHTDPHFTAAWNTLLCGKKRWALFPPECTTSELGMAALEQQVREPPGYWWQDVYPKLVASGRAGQLGMVEAVQGPGDTIYVPQGWHHCVLNLEWTVAVTQNLLMPTMLPAVWPQLEVKFPSFAGFFVRRLRRHRPEIIADLEQRGVLRASDFDDPDSDGGEDEHEGFRL